jgi:hypothetical protein
MGVRHGAGLLPSAMHSAEDLPQPQPADTEAAFLALAVAKVAARHTFSFLPHNIKTADVWLEVLTHMQQYNGQ